MTGQPHPDCTAALRGLLDDADPASHWPALLAEPVIGAMGGCPQHPLWHAEGDVLTHTRMVCEEIVRDPRTVRADRASRAALAVAAVLHDVGKPPRLVDGPVPSSPGHAALGARLARWLLFWAGWPHVERERVTALVRWHMTPFRLFEREEEIRRRQSAMLAEMVDRTELAILCDADVNGRLCPDPQELQVAVALSMLAVEELCEGRQRPGFASGRARRLFLAHPNRPVGLRVAPATGPTVHLVSGLPGAGKGHWARTAHPGVPVLSLDALRRATGARRGHRVDEGRLRQELLERLRSHLRDGQDVIVDAVHLTRHARRAPLRVAADYDCATQIVLVEAPAAEILVRNAARPPDDRVPGVVIDRMVHRWEPPGPDEADDLLVVDGA